MFSCLLGIQLFCLVAVHSQTAYAYNSGPKPNLSPTPNIEISPRKQVVDKTTVADPIAGKVTGVGRRWQTAARDNRLH